MKPRSVIFDIFGTYVRYRGGTIGLSQIVNMLSWFGISDDAARVTLSRMRREGWFETRRAGRSSYYELSDRGWRLLDEGWTRIFERRTDEWTGVWQVIVYQIPEEHRAARERFRKELAWRGFAPLAPSTWISPHDRAYGLADLLPDGAKVQLLTSRTPSYEDDQDIAQSCWDVDALATDYRDFIERYRPLMSEIGVDQLSPEEAFVQRTQATYEYRRFPFRDPDLPARLLPTDWPGHTAHGVFLSVFDRLAKPAWKAFESIYEQPPST
jgi:phenylacetic acid degradation operon negative regulatory protein